MNENRLVNGLLGLCILRRKDRKSTSNDIDTGKMFLQEMNDICFKKKKQKEKNA